MPRELARQVTPGSGSYRVVDGDALKRRLAAARTWVHSVAISDEYPWRTQCNAASVCESLRTRRPLGAEARRWLEYQSRTGDLTHKRFARALLDAVDEIEKTT